jgi:hypothetical protein
LQIPEEPDIVGARFYHPFAVILRSRFLQMEDSMIGFSPETLEELRKRLREMADLELRCFDQRARQLSDPKTNFGATEPHFGELDAARAEWRRRHPKK